MKLVSSTSSFYVAVIIALMMSSLINGKNTWKPSGERIESLDEAGHGVERRQRKLCLKWNCPQGKRNERDDWIAMNFGENRLQERLWR